MSKTEQMFCASRRGYFSDREEPKSAKRDAKQILSRSSRRTSGNARGASRSLGLNFDRMPDAFGHFVSDDVDGYESRSNGFFSSFWPQGERLSDADHEGRLIDENDRSERRSVGQDYDDERKSRFYERSQPGKRDSGTDRDGRTEPRFMRRRSRAPGYLRDRPQQQRVLRVDPDQQSRGRHMEGVFLYKKGNRRPVQPAPAVSRQQLGWSGDDESDASSVQISHENMARRPRDISGVKKSSKVRLAPRSTKKAPTRQI